MEEQEQKQQLDDDMKLFQQIQEQLKKEEKLRSKDKKDSFYSSIAITVAIVTLSSAVGTFYLQDKKENELNTVLKRTIDLSSERFRLSAMEAQNRIIALNSELFEQKQALAKLPIKSNSDMVTTKSLIEDVTSLAVRLTATESVLRQIEASNVEAKMATLEASIEGSVEKVLSVPLIRNDFKNYKVATEKELLRLEKSVEKLEGRLNFFVTTTVTLSMGIFAAVAAPFIGSFSSRPRRNKTSE
ncbi:TPA: hypothetical protein ACX6SV_003012 [Photobacterium damselae]